MPPKAGVPTGPCPTCERQVTYAVHQCPFAPKPAAKPAAKRSAARPAKTTGKGAAAAPKKAKKSPAVSAKAESAKARKAAKEAAKDKATKDKETKGEEESDNEQGQCVDCLAWMSEADYEEHWPNCPALSSQQRGSTSYPNPKNKSSREEKVNAVLEGLVLEGGDSRAGFALKTQQYIENLLGTPEEVYISPSLRALLSGDRLAHRPSLVLVVDGQRELMTRAQMDIVREALAGEEVHQGMLYEILLPVVMAVEAAEAAEMGIALDGSAFAKAMREPEKFGRLSFLKGLEKHLHVGGAGDIATQDKRTCYTCGKTGHIATNCTQAGRGGRGGRGARGNRGGRGRATARSCFKCGSTGHLKKDCTFTTQQAAK